MPPTTPVLSAPRALCLFLCTLTVLTAPGCLFGAESETSPPPADEQEGAGEDGVAGQGAAAQGGAPEGAAADEHAATAAEGAAAPTRMEDGFFMADGAPAPQACSADADCRGDTVPASNGCCQAPHPIRPHSRAYARWVSEWRARSCDGVQCPPPPPPARPAECSFEVRCEAGQCRDACP
jgi:hypothetical protein